MSGHPSLSQRTRQAWTIATIELRRVFFAKRSLWVFGLALLPAAIFFGHGVETKFRSERLASRGLTAPALIDSVREGEPLEEVRKRVGKPAEERWSIRTHRIRRHNGSDGTTTHVVTPPVDARFVRLNITEPSYRHDEVARIYEFEVYGPDGRENLALHRPATGSSPCTPGQGPEKAVNGSVSGGKDDSWCAEDWPLFLQVDLGSSRRVARFVVKHASAGGEDEDSDTREFNIQVSTEGKTFTTVAASAGTGYVDERTEYRDLIFFDGRRQARMLFVDGRLQRKDVAPLLNFEEDRTIFAGIFQFFYLRLAVFFGCLGMFVRLFRGEMTSHTLHFWLLAPARREVLLAGKYMAGLLSAALIFGGGALLAFVAMIWPHDAFEVHAYWTTVGQGHLFWYVTAAVLGCVGYGGVFLAIGLYVRNPIVPAAGLLGWEAASGVLPHLLQKASILYYLQSLCPFPAPMDDDVPTLVRLLASPAAPASRPAAVLGLLVLTSLVLWVAARAVRKMQISYGADA